MGLISFMPQNKITPPDHNQAPQELPDLTDKQLAYVTKRLEGLGITDAYRASYDASGMTNEATWVEASRTEVHPKISLWLRTARQATLAKRTITLEGHVDRLTQLSERAEASGNYGAAVQAEVHVGKATGLYIERHQDVDRGRELTILDRIFKRYGRTAGLAAAERLGLEPQEYSHILGQDQVTH
jgi:hypothetical protein